MLVGALGSIGHGSITDGYDSTPDANHRWPNYLAARFAAKLGSRPGSYNTVVLI